jgi:hypothetical protein
MGCADCHTVDGANTTAGNAHGSDSEYLLKDGEGLARLGRLSPGAGEGSYTCLACHEASHYDDSSNTHTGSSSNDYADTVGVTNTLPDLAERVADDSNLYGSACLNCHGGILDNTGTEEFGTIHGTSQIFDIRDSKGAVVGTRMAYRFTNGNSLRFYDPNGWTASSATCFTLDRNEDDDFGGCIKHGGGQGFTKPAALNSRPLSY